MAILFGGSRINDKTPPATSLRVQTALSGQPIPIVYGQQRIAGNLIWYGGFKSIGSSNSGGGKSGGGGGKGGIAGGGKGQSGQTAYSADVIIGLCEGTIWKIDTIWSGQSLETMAKLGITEFAGGQGQAPWGFLTSQFPQYALGYSALGYVGANPLQLGSSPELPSLNFEVAGPISGAVQETCTVASGAGYAFTPAYFNLTASVTEQVTIPATAPYQIQAQNPTAQTHILVAGGGAIIGADIPGSASQGVIDANGRVFTRVASAPASGQYVIAKNAIGWLYGFAAVDAGLPVTLIDLAVSPGAYRVGSGWMSQVVGTPAEGEFQISVQPGSYGQYQFAATDAGKQIIIADIIDADPSAVLFDYLSNPLYGCGFPQVNIANLATLQNYAFAAGLFISPAIVSAQAANAFLADFALGLNGAFVWSSGLLNFVPYGDTAMAGFGKSYAPPAVPIYWLDDDDFLRNEGTASVGVSAFTGDDPVICVRPRPNDADNEVKVEYLDRGNSYNPAIVSAQDDAAINAYGLRVADTKQLHFFCAQAPAMMSAQLQLARQQVRNLYSFTVPWYFILLDPMDIVAISDAALGLENQWVRIREITENQQDGTLTVTAEEYLQGTGSSGLYGSQPSIGYVPNIDATASAVN